MALSAAVGLALLILGTRLLGGRYGVLGQGFLGGGLATLYFSVFAAHRLFGLIDVGTAFALMRAITVLAGGIAVRFDLILVAVLGTGPRDSTSLPRNAVLAAPDRLRARLPYRALFRRRMHSWPRSARAGLDRAPLPFRGGLGVPIATNAVVPRGRRFIGSSAGTWRPGLPLAASANGPSPRTSRESFGSISAAASSASALQERAAQFLRHGLLDAEAAADMRAWESSGFSIDASVRIVLVDRDVPSYSRSLEHLLRYCARPAFAPERLSLHTRRDGDPERIRSALPRHKRGQWVGPGRKRTATVPGNNGVVDLAPGEFLDRLADLVPPPRKHRHRYHGVFAPNHPLRPAVTALAIANATARANAASSSPLPLGERRGEDAQRHAQPRSHDTSRIAWAKLMAKIAEDFLLACPACGGDIRLIAFITDPAPIRKILTYLGKPREPPQLAPARGPPTGWAELVQANDDRDAIHASPRDLPVIDIRSL